MALAPQDTSARNAEGFGRVADTRCGYGSRAANLVWPHGFVYWRPPMKAPNNHRDLQEFVLATIRGPGWKPGQQVVTRASAAPAAQDRASLNQRFAAIARRTRLLSLPIFCRISVDAHPNQCGGVHRVRHAATLRGGGFGAIRATTTRVMRSQMQPEHRAWI
jgi:hypothetical protein